MDISTLLNLINYIFVLIFGIIVSFYFADIRLEDNHKLFIYTTLTFALFQAVCYLLLGQNVLYKSYPFLIHIPLILVIRFVCHKNIYISSIAVLSAYLMCTPKKMVRHCCCLHFQRYSYDIRYCNYYYYNPTYIYCN